MFWKFHTGDRLQTELPTAVMCSESKMFHMGREKRLCHLGTYCNSVLRTGMCKICILSMLPSSSKMCVPLTKRGKTEFALLYLSLTSLQRETEALKDVRDTKQL